MTLDELETHTSPQVIQYLKEQDDRLTRLEQAANLPPIVFVPNPEPSEPSNI